MYAPAYTTRFNSVDGTLYELYIVIDGFDGRPEGISLEGDEPCVIEWQETSRTDAVQPSLCTLRVSNESDRQVASLMDRPAAGLMVMRDGALHWMGTLDDAVYEEPYSFDDGYVTELTFSDFGILNRTPFTLTGKQCVADVVALCLLAAGFSNIPVNLLCSLLDEKERPVTLDRLYLNADRFDPNADPWQGATTMRTVLEEVLRALGLRIVQHGGQLYIYDTEWLRDHPRLHHPVVWKGTDAYMRGSESYGRFEVAFEQDATDTLADGTLEYGNHPAAEDTPLFAKFLTAEGRVTLQTGFELFGHDLPDPSPVGLGGGTKLMRTSGVMTDTHDVCIAWRALCRRLAGSSFGIAGIPVSVPHTFAGNRTALLIADCEPVFSLTSEYLPKVPGSAAFQLRVGLDMILSFRPNPFDRIEELRTWMAMNPHSQYQWAMDESMWRDKCVVVMLVPVKLEVIDDNGNPVFHYKNATGRDVENKSGRILPVFDPIDDIAEGQWIQGPAGGFGDMVLAYYEPDAAEALADYMDAEENGDDDDDDDEEEEEDKYDTDPLVKAGGWTTNRPLTGRVRPGNLYANRTPGEYLPLPPVAGRLRLTVSSGAVPWMRFDGETWYENNSSHLAGLYTRFSWHLFRNPTVAVVRASRRDDAIDAATDYSRAEAASGSDTLSDTLSLASWNENIAPSARGLFFDAGGLAFTVFVRNGRTDTLQRHRLRCIKDQHAAVQPALEGTAEPCAPFGARTDASTPGAFLVTARRQDLHQDTEHLTMVHIAPDGSFSHEARWIQPLCALAPAPFAFEWGRPQCARIARHTATWGRPQCARQREHLPQWEPIEQQQAE